MSLTCIIACDVSKRRAAWRRARFNQLAYSRGLAVEWVSDSWVVELRPDNAAAVAEIWREVQQTKTKGAQ